VQTLKIPSPTGELTAFYHTKTTSPRPLLLICHGFCGSPDGGSGIELAEELVQRDFSVLRIRFTPQQPLSHQMGEIGAAINFCRQHLTSRIALLGRSMGAAASLAFAARNPELSGLCLMASPADLPQTFRHGLGKYYERLETGETVEFVSEGITVHLEPEFVRDFARHDLLADVRNLSGMPLLIIHGLADETVPVENGRQLFAAAGQPKDLVLLPGVPHSFVGQAEHFVSLVADWLEAKVFPATPVL
jgi:uncharacterized protein